MKVLIVSDYGTPTGGAEIMGLLLRDALRARGHDARLFASSARPDSLPIEADYVTLGTASRLRTYLQVANPAAATRLRQVIATFRPDVVHVRMFLTQLSPLILPVLTDVPSLFHVTDYRSVCPTGLKFLPGGTLCTSAYGGVCLRERCLPIHHWMPLMVQMSLWSRWTDAFNSVVANSHWMLQRLRSSGLHVDTAIWNGVSSESPRPPLTSAPTVAFAGRLVREKGVEVLVRAMARVVEEIPEGRLLIAGDGPERHGLDQRVRELGLSGNVTFLGRVPRSELGHAFRKVWVQAVPSLWEEPFGLVAAESMMRGTAVVVSDHGGLSEIVEHGVTGLRVCPGDPEALAGALVHFLGNRARAESAGAAARAFACERLSEDRFTEDFLRQYDRLLSD